MTIVDVTASAMKEFLRCFYLKRVKLTVENVAKVLYLSEKYGIGQCKAACTKLMLSKFTADNVCQVQPLDMLFNQTDLKLMCEYIIRYETKEVFKSKAFLTCKSVLNHILHTEDLSCPETAVFEACMEWVKMASKQNQLTKELVRSHLGEIFYQIRYRSMSFDRFSALRNKNGRIRMNVDAIAGRALYLLRSKDIT